MDEFNKVVNTQKQGVSVLIEKQEKEGQEQLVASKILPVESEDGVKETLESFGFKFLGVVDDDPIFQRAEFPAGWYIKPVDHNMWTLLMDDKSRQRASIFYKAAFYDRRSYLHLTTALTLGHTYSKPFDQFVVKKYGKPIFSGPPYKSFGGSEDYRVYMKREAEAEKPAAEFLATNYPDYKNPRAYWD